MNKKLLVLTLLLAGNTLFADRWLILPPRIENTAGGESLGASAQAGTTAADLARVRAPGGSNA